MVPKRAEDHIHVGCKRDCWICCSELFLRTFRPVSHKSDAYSYGILLLEMTGAGKQQEEVVQRSEVYFPNWIYEHLENDEEKGLCGVTNKEDEETTKKMVLVGLWCIQTNPSDRSLMSKVVDMLEGDLESLQIPPKPFLIAAARPDLSPLNSLEPLSSTSNVVENLMAVELSPSEAKQELEWGHRKISAQKLCLR